MTERLLTEEMAELKKALRAIFHPVVLSAVRTLDRTLRRSPRLYGWLEEHETPRWMIYVSPLHWMIWLWTGRRP